MNKKHAVDFSTFSKKVILSTTFIFSLGVFSTAQAEQSIVANPMLSSAPVRYGTYSSSSPALQIQSTAPSAKTKSSRHSKKDANAGTVNINSATETELVALPGIGPSKAHAIAEYRQQQGGFKSVDDLRQVKGIGPATLDKLRAHVTL